jgi:hypothetical protein
LTAPVFPDIEVLISLVLQDLAGGPEHADSETPDDLLDRLPFIRSLKVDGDRSRISDRPVLEVDVFGPSRAVAQPLSERVYERLMRVPAPHPAIDTVITVNAPRELPWGDNRIRRWSATYAFSLRRTRIQLL